ncbi:MAG: response regulator transcription factor [Planctomycetota bacterium]|jgi:FixJ family two-component response regulator
MTDIVEQSVFVVDNELKVLEVVGETLGSLGIEVTCFVHPAKCLERLSSQKCDLLIADLKMPEMDGMELVASVKRMAPWVPVLIIIGYGDVRTAVRAIKAGAVDFIEKPLDKQNLVRTVKAILQENVLPNASVGKPLTAVEAKILKLVIDGKSNRDIAELLKRSVRTIEVHRAHMMDKLGVKSLLDLVKRAVTLGLIDLPANHEPGETMQDPEPG